MRPRPRHLSILVVLAACGAMLLAGCADGGSGDPATTPTPTATSSPSTPSTPGGGTTEPLPPSATPPTLPPPSPPVRQPEPTDRAGQATLTGEVIAGVEAGCRVLQTGSGDYLLIGETATQLQVGRTVTVRGTVRADLATTCQQGTPFEVTEVVD